MIEQFSVYQRGCGFADATIKRRRLTLRSLACYWAPKTFAQLTTMDIEEWLQTKAAARTRSAYRSDVRMFYEWANGRDLLDVNPASKVGRVKVPKSLPRPLGPEAAVLLQHGSRSTRQMVALAMYAGLRCGEIAVIRCEDIWLHHEDGAVVVRDGKGGKDRSVPMSAELRDVLGNLPSSGWLFRGRNGGPLTSGSVSGRITRHMRRTGIDGTPHQLRHTFGTAVARNSDGDVLLTAAWMGHGSPNTTMGYVALSASRRRDVIEGLYAADKAS